MFRLSDIVRKMFRRAATRSLKPDGLRTRLDVMPLEDRTVPSTVTIAALADATEGGSSGTFQFTRDGSTSSALSVNIAISGTATYSTDYGFSGLASSSDEDGRIVSVVIPVGVTSANWSVNAVNDTSPEFDETVYVSIQSSVSYLVGSPGSATVMIHDNDTPVVGVETINDAAEGGTAGVFRLTRQGDKSGTLTVNYSLGGTAVNGTDFTALSGTVTFVAGDVTADVDVAAIHDGINDPDETVVLTVTSGTGYTVGSPSTATVNVIDTDILPVAFDDSETTSINTALNISALDLATSLYGDALTVTSVTQGDNGSVVINLNGTV